MNRMPEVAKLLGVELGEWFRVNGSDYCLTGDGISNEYGVLSPIALNNLLTGACELKKHPFRPKLNEKYYYVCDNGDVSYYNNDFSVADLSIIAFGNCFRSKAEAEANKDRILAKFEEIKKEMEG